MAGVVALGAALLGRRLGGVLSCRPWPASCSGVCTAIRRLSLDNTPSAPPKRPLSAYLRYVVEQQQNLFKQSPDIKLSEKTKQIAHAWRQLTPDQKQPYELAASDAKLKYKVELAAFKANLTPAQLASLKEERRQKLAKRRTMRKKRKLTILGKPKRPRTAFNIFMAENFEEAKGATSQAKLKNLQDEWHRQSDQQKQMYTQLAEDDKVRYQNEIKLWEEQMIETGHGDVIRVKQKRRVQKLLRKKVNAHKMADKTTKPSATSSTTKAIKSKKTSEE
ncbi:transcription factor A, mitochondrial isoform X1 [Chiloscyllium plagiosum]|uniref:transcription factor A, mitochondrial isoform X1 n=1 Tax=Chiloscyllium plagiosum TaxID=36176 RepID=UPI001CB877A2|nr:transcription factor A, mitochondrial isoform X1 [Chiloscyllium plagiosum]